MELITPLTIGVKQMKVTNITNDAGRAVPNQFIINDDRGNIYFQSYNSIIVKIGDLVNTGDTFDTEKTDDRHKIQLDSIFWDYSKTTGRYRNQFLGETKKETQAKIDSGEYMLTDLN